MKNILFLASCFSLLFYSCNDDLLKNPELFRTIILDSDSIPAFTVSTPHTEPALPRGWRDKIITDSQFNVYESSRNAKVTNNESLRGDTRIFGYTWAEFVEYMDHVEKLTDSLEVNIDSIQFILTAYEANPRHNGARFNTMVVKPTIEGFEFGKDGFKFVEPEKGGFFLNFFAPPVPDPGDEDDLNNGTILDYSGCCPN